MTPPRIRLPAPAEPLREAYRQLVAELDHALTQLISSRFPDTLQCRPGCVSCCIPFSVLPLEAALIAGELPLPGVSGGGGTESCVFLAEGLCRIYALRPIICRSQGVPLGYIDEVAETIEVSACHLNFPAEVALSQDDLLYMDSFNQRLAELNLHYCREAGIEPEQRIGLTELGGVSPAVPEP